MIRHIVLIRFRDDVPDATIDAIFADLHSIRAVLPGVLNITSGAAKAPNRLNAAICTASSPISPIGTRWPPIRPIPNIAASATP